ncbi:MAG: prepilin-type N-terminal cleavage/methylation domain-containing protein [Gemmatimonadales bacterium]
MTRRGFTLIELLVVVVVIGILATIAIPKFGGAKQKAFVAAMKSDLKNFVTAEESYLADYNQYGTAANVVSAGLFKASTDVALVSTDGNATGFSATATHPGLGGKTCGVFVGDATAPAMAPNEGEVKCD